MPSYYYTPGVFVKSECDWLLLYAGRVVEPNKESANFFSITEYTDKRVDLDKSIKPGDWRYLSALSIMAAKASYENKAYLETIVRDHWKV